MILSWLLIVAGGLMLVGGGESLLRGAVGLSTRLGLTPAVIGLTVVAAGTSIPELAVSIVAAIEHRADIAVANVVGSNIFNIAIIVGMCALFRPIAIVGTTTQLEYPVLAVVTLLCVVIAQDGTIHRLDALLLLIGYAALTAYLVRLVRRQITVSEVVVLRHEVDELAPGEERPRPRLWQCLAYVVVGTVLLGVGASTTVHGAVRLARLLGWSERIIGLTIVSAGTGLPEVVASLVSSVRGRSDVAMGNVIGSNLFNTLVILGCSGVIQPLAVSPALVDRDLWWMLGVTAVLFPIIVTGRRVSRWEGALLLGIYSVYLSYLFAATT